MEEALLSDKVPHEWGEVSEEKIWSNLEYFLKAVQPYSRHGNPINVALRRPFHKCVD